MIHLQLFHFDDVTLLQFQDLLVDALLARFQLTRLQNLVCLVVVALHVLNLLLEVLVLHLHKLEPLLQHHSLLVPTLTNLTLNKLKLLVSICPTSHEAAPQDPNTTHSAAALLGRTDPSFHHCAFALAVTDPESHASIVARGLTDPTIDPAK